MIDQVAACNLYLRWLLSDEPSQAWQRAYLATAGTRRPLRWMSRHLKIDPADSRASFALCGFAPMQVGGVWHIGATLPAPSPFDASSMPGDTVVLVDPEANTASVLGEPGPALITPSPQPETLFVHTSPMKWLRQWADERVVYLETRRAAMEQSRIIPSFSGEPPAALAIGDLKQVPWAGLYARTIRAEFEVHLAIKKAIFKAADLPRVEAA